MEVKIYDRVMVILNEKGRMRLADIVGELLETDSMVPMEITRQNIWKLYGYIAALIDLDLIGYEKIDGEAYVYIKGVNKDEI